MKKKRKSEGLFIEIRKAVSMVPEGKVVTYGQAASMVDLADARKVGWAIYGNTDPKIPCHRVVFFDTGLAVNYSLGGYREQKKRLKQEGIEFFEERKIDLLRYQWKPKK
jgi:methylated-DNA-protein-cysteine methyltransferase-like protein